MTTTQKEKLTAEILYNAYGNSAGWLNYQGGQIPTFTDLPAEIKENWEAVATRAERGFVQAEPERDAQENVLDLETRAITNQLTSIQYQIGSLKCQLESLQQRYEGVESPVKADTLERTTSLVGAAQNALSRCFRDDTI